MLVRSRQRDPESGKVKITGLLEDGDRACDAKHSSLHGIVESGFEAFQDYFQFLGRLVLSGSLEPLIRMESPTSSEEYPGPEGAVQRKFCEFSFCLWASFADLSGSRDQSPPVWPSDWTDQKQAMRNCRMEKQSQFPTVLLVEECSPLLRFGSRCTYLFRKGPGRPIFV